MSVLKLIIDQTYQNTKAELKPILLRLDIKGLYISFYFMSVEGAGALRLDCAYGINWLLSGLGVLICLVYE
jgi:hypothetical protein